MEEPQADVITDAIQQVLCDASKSRAPNTQVSYQLRQKEWKVRFTTFTNGILTSDGDYKGYTPWKSDFGFLNPSIIATNQRVGLV